MEDTYAVPVFFVEGVSFVDPPSADSADREAFHQFFPISDIYSKPQEFNKAALRLVLGNKCVQMRCVARPC
eukprot:358478-Chlamydomonas_euryale.AAC.28